MEIPQLYADPTVNLVLDTIQRGKQALVFCNTKRGAESQAEQIAVKVKHTVDLTELADAILSAVDTPTKQCKRLALCVRKGIAFHHAGLNAKQRALVEESFRAGELSTICSTPTLAMGMDLPAYRSIVRDVKRYSTGKSWGMADIPVLEWEQMAGRAGRPGKEDTGQAILIAKSESEKEHLVEKYVNGDPEEIFSKLAVEPVLRTYVLSLIATGYVHDKASLYAFFDKTFYAQQYEDLGKLHGILDKMIRLLAEWLFITAPGESQDDFVVAGEMREQKLAATRLGTRVAELYLDPLTAHHLLSSLEKSLQRRVTLKPFNLLHLLSTTLEIRPLFSIRKAEMDDMDALLVEQEEDLIVRAPTIYSYEYEEYLQSLKTAKVLQEWIDEVGEDFLLAQYNVRPGEMQAKRQNADWLLYSLIELAKLQGWQGMISEFQKLRVRLEHGAKEELLTLLRLKNVGRVRARVMYKNGIRNLGDLKKAEYSTLRKLLGPKISADLKEQVGEKVLPEDVQVKQNKRKGQINLDDFSTPHKKSL